MAISEMLYPLCKFDYDLMWLLLQITPALVAALVVYNGIKLMSDNEETRMNGKRGIKNAFIGLILIIAFSGIGCMVLPGCVPCPTDPHSPPADIRSGMTPLNIWITEPANGATITGAYDPAIKGFEVEAKCDLRGSGSVIWNFNDPHTKTETFTGSCAGAKHVYNVSDDEYDITATAVNEAGDKAVHKIRVRVIVNGVPT